MDCLSEYVPYPHDHHLVSQATTNELNTLGSQKMEVLKMVLLGLALQTDHLSFL